MNKRLINILFFVTVAIYLNAQSPTLVNEVRTLLPGTNTQSIELYGYFDHIYEVQLYLIHNDDEWKGICYYPSSKTKIYLEGGMVKGNLILDESDKENDKIGMWLIKINQNNHPAKWMNISKSVSFDLQLKELNKTNKALDFHFSSIDKYEGKLSNQKISLITYNTKSDNIKVNIVNLNKSIYLQNSTKCLNPNCSSFEIQIPNNKENKKLECKQIGNGILKITAFNQMGTGTTSLFQKIETLKLKEVSYIDKYYHLYLIHPVFDNMDINKTFQNELLKITDSLKVEMNQIILSEPNINDRLNLHAKAWFDVEFFSKEIFSGVFLIQRSYSDQVESIPIIFSLKDGKKIKIHKQFKSDFDTKSYFNQFLKENIKKIPGYKTGLLRIFLKPKNFKNITINGSGIVFSTDFNSIFGIYKTILPFKKIQDKMLRKSIITKLIPR